jgi:hypothetical protein
MGEVEVEAAAQQTGSGRWVTRAAKFKIGESER